MTDNALAYRVQSDLCRGHLIKQTFDQTPSSSTKPFHDRRSNAPVPGAAPPQQVSRKNNSTKPSERPSQE
jgi:hypothetical protein